MLLSYWLSEPTAETAVIQTGAPSHIVSQDVMSWSKKDTDLFILKKRKEH